MSEDTIQKATFSPCKKYRYVLTRVWNIRERGIVFVGLNPSTADESKDDPTIRRCIGFAKSWGYGGIHMLNLFAFCSTNPAELKKQADPVGKENEDFLRTYLKSFRAIVCYGNGGNYLNKHKEFIKKYKEDVYAIKILKNGMPAHPLYLKKNLKPIKLNCKRW